MALPALAGLISAIDEIKKLDTTNIKAAVGDVLSGTATLEKSLQKINTELDPVTDAFNKTATQAAVLYGTFFKLKAGFDTAVDIIGKVGGTLLSIAGTVASTVATVVATVVKTVVSAILKGVNLAFATATTAINGDLIAKPIQVLAGAISLLQQPVLNVVGALGQFQQAVTSLGRAMLPFVEKASPGVASLFTQVSNDFTASIGRAMVPALQQVTKFTRAFADVTFALAGPVAALVRAFDPLLALLPKITDALTPVLRFVGKFIVLLAELVRPLADLTATVVGSALEVLTLHLKGMFAQLTPGITILAEVTRATATFFKMLQSNGVFDLLRQAGLLGGDTVTGESVGAAATGAQVGSVESALNRALSSAFSIGGAASPEERSATYLQDMLDKVKGIADDMTVLITNVEQLPENIANAIKGTVGGAPKAASGVAGAPIIESGSAGYFVNKADEWASRNVGFGFR
jgi:hypothetical protein